jgi:hypothetical protein
MLVHVGTCGGSQKQSSETSDRFFCKEDTYDKLDVPWPAPPTASSPAALSEHLEALHLGPANSEVGHRTLADEPTGRCNTESVSSNSGGNRNEDVQVYDKGEPSSNVACSCQRRRGPRTRGWLAP